MDRSLAHVFDEVDASLRAIAIPSAAAKPSAAVVEAAIRRFVADLPRAFTITVPGSHAGGISHNDLLKALAQGGRDFLAQTIQLAQAVKLALTREFMPPRTMPTTQQLQTVAAVAILDHIEKRFSRGNGDLIMQPLTPDYRIQKARKGRSGQPIGVATGELRAAFSRSAKVRWL
jgi:hypothetical protein